MIFYISSENVFSWCVQDKNSTLLTVFLVCREYFTGSTLMHIALDAYIHFMNECFFSEYLLSIIYSS
jgi:hypothetical protein